MRLIIKRMQRKYINIGWKYLSEENSKVDSYNLIKNTDWVWILDPLDGTKDFIQGTGNYAMHLALNYKKKPLYWRLSLSQKKMNYGYLMRETLV